MIGRGTQSTNLRQHKDSDGHPCYGRRTTTARPREEMTVDIFDQEELIEQLLGEVTA